MTKRGLLSVKILQKMPSYSRGKCKPPSLPHPVLFVQHIPSMAHTKATLSVNSVIAKDLSDGWQGWQGAI